MIQTVKLSKLRLSGSNVRKTGALDLEPLAADLAARGVLQNLLVTPVTKPRGTFEVFAGGRRLRALQLLAERGAIVAKDYDVPVRVLEADQQTLAETSTAENFQRLAMTPADECRAFQHFLGTDGDVDAVAKRFGVTRRFIEGRLRLATLAEPIFAALSAGDLTLNHAKAYAATDNHERQLMVFEAYGSHSYATADTIRRAITSETMQATDPVAMLVGEPAYVAAGGRIDRDLFGDHGDRWRDPEIAQRLAASRMEEEAKRLVADTGLGWVRPITSSYAYDAARDLHAVPLAQPALSETEADHLAGVQERLDAIADAMDDETLDTDRAAALEAEYETLDSERAAIVDRPRVLPDELRPLVGAFLLLNHHGQMALDTRYYSEVPLRPAATAGATGANGPGGGSPTLSPDGLAPGGKPLSAKLADELAMQSRDVLAAALLAQPALALDYALFTMADGHFHRLADHGSTISARPPSDPAPGDLPTSRAGSYLADIRATLAHDWSESDATVARFDAFRALDDEAKAGWLAYLVARALEAKSTSRPGSRPPIHARLAELLALEPASWWRPTSENFFDRVSKTTLLALLEEVGGPAFAARYVNAKKGELSESCEKLFAGEAIVEAEVKERALAWLPNAMRFGPGAGTDAVTTVTAEADDGSLDDDAVSPPSGLGAADTIAA